MPVDIQLPSAIWAGLFVVSGVILAAIPARSADCVRSRGIPLRIGGPIETTPKNVRIIGIVFVVAGAGFLALTLWFALGNAETPPLNEIASYPELVPVAIDAAKFERPWSAAPWLRS